jgi:hypothetical protein
MIRWKRCLRGAHSLMFNEITYVPSTIWTPSNSTAGKWSTLKRIRFRLCITRPAAPCAAQP